MANITLSIEPEVVKKVRRIALERDTTLTAMVREYLKQVAASDVDARQRAVERLRESFKKHSVHFGAHDWTRDDLHER